MTSSPRVIFEDKDFVVLDKPAGLLVHPYRVPTEGGKKRIKDFTLADWLLKHYPETGKVGDNPEMRPGMVHRLDRDTSGLILVARNEASFLHFKNLFKTREIKKTYLAIVWGEVQLGEQIVDTPIGLKEGTTRRIVGRGKMLKESLTKFSRLKTFIKDGESFSLLEVRPVTGRTHQIRVHLSSVGHPIVGDTLYGSKKESSFFKEKPRLMLHSSSLEIITPIGHSLKIEADPPREFSHFIEGEKEQSSKTLKNTYPQ